MHTFINLSFCLCENTSLLASLFSRDVSTYSVSCQKTSLSTLYFNLYKTHVIIIFSLFNLMTAHYHLPPFPVQTLHNQPPHLNFIKMHHHQLYPYIKKQLHIQPHHSSLLKAHYHQA